MFTDVSVILCGFSIVSALVLLCAYLFFLPGMHKTLTGKISCTAVLLGVVAVQIAHYVTFTKDVDVLALRSYSLLLAFVPGAFFFFSREILFARTVLAARDIIHLIPLVLALILPLKAAPPVAFAGGALYTLYFVQQIALIRPHSGRFNFELFFFGLFFLMAVVALVLGLALPVLDTDVYYHSYSAAISIAMILVVAALLSFPELLSDIAQITETAYANSRLESVDVSEKSAELERLMNEERRFEDEELNLSQVASSLSLSSHQLSELINRHFDLSFPKYVREHRVRAAKRMLLDEPTASVLSVGLAVGFKSQSTFYSAFREATGQSPGEFRTKQLKNE